MELPPAESRAINPPGASLFQRGTMGAGWKTRRLGDLLRLVVPERDDGCRLENAGGRWEIQRCGRAGDVDVPRGIGLERVGRIDAAAAQISGEGDVAVWVQPGYEHILRTRQMHLRSAG